MIDGEGWLGVAKEKNPAYTLGFSMRCRLQVVNTNRQLLERIRSIIGEGRLWQSRPATDRWSALYCYAADGPALRRVLPQIAPLLVSKRNQAELLLQLLQFTNHVAVKYRSRDEVRQMLRLHAEIRRLNSKGGKIPPRTGRPPRGWTRAYSRPDDNREQRGEHRSEN